MDDLIDFYDTYGENLAKRLTCIGHSDERKAYVKVADVGSPEEVLKALASGLKADTSVLIWEQFTEDLDDAGRDNYHTALTGSVAVIRKANTDVPSKRDAVKQSRQAVLKVIALMLQDAYSGVLLEHGVNFRVRRQSGQEIANLGTGWWGYGFQFSWEVPLDLTLQAGDVLDLPD